MFNNPHTLFGTVIVCLLVIQPALGQLHHQYFLKNGSRGIVSYVHLWWGRILIVFGTINGGVGLQMSNVRKRYIIAYALIAVFMYLIYAGVKGLRVSRQRRMGGGAIGKASPRTGYVEQGDEVPMTTYGRQSHFGKQ